MTSRQRTKPFPPARVRGGRLCASSFVPTHPGSFPRPLIDGCCHFAVQRRTWAASASWRLSFNSISLEPAPCRDTTEFGDSTPFSTGTCHDGKLSVGHSNKETEAGITWAKIKSIYSHYTKGTLCLRRTRGIHRGNPAWNCDVCMMGGSCDGSGGGG